MKDVVKCKHRKEIYSSSKLFRAAKSSIFDFFLFFFEGGSESVEEMDISGKYIII